MKPFLIHALAALVLAAAAGQAAAQAAANVCNGTVTVERKGADVIVTGDDGDNCIHMFDEYGQGHIILLAFGGTTLAEGTEGATDDTWIELWDPGNLRIDLGKGNDRLEAMDVHRPDIRWNVRAGEGDDLLAFGTMTLDKLVVRGGRGNDTGSFYDVTARQVRFAAAVGGADAIFATDEIPANLKVRSVELPAAPPPGCPIAEETLEGLVLLGTSELDVTQCNVKKELDGTETGLFGELYGFSKTGDSISYYLYVITPAGLSILPEQPLAQVASVYNRSLAEPVVDVGSFFKTPRYMIEGLRNCYDVLIAACPDHLNRYGSVKDTGPGGTDGVPL